MRPFSTRLVPPSWFVLLVVAIGIVAGASAQAQIIPPWDHYKVYIVPNGPPLTIPVVLYDQFGVSTAPVTMLERFMNPVEKAIPGGAVYPITDPFLHYTWWRIDHGNANEWRVAVSNQFGDQTLHIYDQFANPIYLLNPALKNQAGGTLPSRNHYKCYPCTWWDVPQPLPAILMTDQFGQWTANVMMPAWFCNPVEKHVGPDIHPIIEPAQHYVCYHFDPMDPGIYPITFMDQFMPSPIPVDLAGSNMICVPSLKQSAVGSLDNTWGKLKVLYR